MAFHRCELFSRIQHVEVSLCLQCGSVCLLRRAVSLGSNDGEWEVCAQAVHPVLWDSHCGWGVGERDGRTGQRERFSSVTIPTKDSADHMKALKLGWALGGVPSGGRRASLYSCTAVDEAPGGGCETWAGQLPLAQAFAEEDWQLRVFSQQHSCHVGE